MLTGRYDEAEKAARARLQTVIRSSGVQSLAAAAASDLMLEAAIRNGKAGSPEILDLAERTLRGKERLLGAGHRDTVVSLTHLAEALAEVPDHPRAVARAREAVRIAKSSKGFPRQGLADALDTLGLVLGRSGAYEEAVAVLKQSLQVRESVGPGPDTLLTRTLELLVSTLQTTGNYAAARPFAVRALETRESHPAQAASIAALNVYARQLWFEGRAEDARRWSQEALARSEKLLRPHHPAIVESIINLAASLVLSGDVRPARALQQRALTIAEMEWGADHYRTAACLNDLANSDLLLGNYSEARREFERALNIAEKRFGRLHEWVATHIHNLALVDAHLGDAVSATRRHAEAVAIWESVRGVDHPFVAVALTELAAVIRDHGQVERSVPLLERALAIREHSLGRDHRDVAQTLTDLAAAHLRMGRTASADELLTRSLAVWERADALETADFAATLALFAELQATLGHQATARTNFERALAIQGKIFGPLHPAYADTQIGLALVLTRLGDRSSAISIAHAAESTGREHLRLMVRALPERESLNYAVSRPKALDLMLSLVGSARGAAATALDALIRSRALVLDEMISRVRPASPGSGELADLRGRLLSAQERLASLVVRGPEDLAAEPFAMLVEQTRQAKEEAERLLAERSARFRAELSYERAGFEDVRRALPDGSVLLSFVRYRHLALARTNSGSSTQPGADVSSYAVFVVRSRGVPAVVSLGAASSIDALVATWRSDIAASIKTRAQHATEPSATRTSGARLRRAIWDPVSAHIQGATMLFVVPDDALSLVPLTALPGRRAEFLLEESPAIHYLTAERDVIRANEQPDELPRSLLAFGGPAFDNGSMFSLNRSAGSGAAGGAAALRSVQSNCDSFQTLEFGTLAGTVQEVQDVAQLWRNLNGALSARVLVSAEATERQFKQEAPKHQVIHLATHGFFLGGSCPSTTEGLRAVGGLVPGSRVRAGPMPPAIAESPLLLSGLALAGANRRRWAGIGEEDGILTAEEVSGLDLSGVRWAVLSACDTGVGEVRAGEGVFGLRRAFQIAGARTVIMSLWSVEDDSTRLWMHALYEGRLKRALRTADAVHQASLSILRTRRAAGLSTEPFYWAAFVAVGDWR